MKIDKFKIALWIPLIGLIISVSKKIREKYYYFYDIDLVGLPYAVWQGVTTGFSLLLIAALIF